MIVRSMTRRDVARLVAGAAAGLVASPRVSHAAFPERTLRIMVGFGPGGTVDTIARILANAIGPLLGQTMIVENRPGASASIAANVVVQSAPDGHTLLFGVFSHAVAPALVRLNYDTLKDLTAVSQVASVPLFMFAAEKSAYRSVADVVDAAKAAPGTVTYASGGVGSSAHLAAELFARRAGISLVHVPYRGGGQTVQSLLSGEVALMWDTPQPGTRSFVEEGKLRALTVMSGKRLPSFPEVPAISELGLGDGLEVQAWQGVLVRSGTPPAIVDALYRAIAQGMALSETRQRIEAMAVEPLATDPAAFGAFFQSEVVRWTEVARGAGIQAQ
jgi:tripartite-type tricarboxylate transporter receptor subunit TctC